MTVTITIEREGPANLTPEEEHELEQAAAQAVISTVRGAGDFQLRRITMAVRRGALRG